MSYKRTVVMFLLLIALAGCANVSQQTATRPNPQSDALLRAAREGHAETIKTLLTSPGVDVNARDEQGNSALIEAARFGHNDVVRALLVAKADVHARNNDGKTPLSLAAQGGHTETVQLLKQAGAVD